MNSTNERRVVVTGMGTVNPLGNSVDQTWNSIMGGTSGIGPITRFDPTDYATRIAGEVRNFDYTGAFSEEMLKKARRMDPFCHYAVAAVAEAVAQSGLTDLPPEQVGVSVGSGIGGIDVQHQNSIAFERHGPKRVSPFYIPMTIGNMASGVISMIYGFTGPNLSVQTACATGNHSIAMAMLIIESGMATAMVAGGTESPIYPFAVAGFSNMRVLSTRNDSPQTASRPYDRDRDGLVVGEGAAILILEEYQHAKERGADIVCEVVSCGMSADAYDFVAPEPEGRGAFRAMQMALEQGRTSTDDVDYINTHGTSTQLGDVAELRGIHRLFGGEGPQISSTKSYHGHLLGATAGLEAIITARTLATGTVPANINIFERDPELPKVSLPVEPLEMPVQMALSNSFGVGGHNSSLLLRRV